MPINGLLEVTILGLRDFTTPGPGLPPVERAVDQVLTQPNLLADGTWQTISVMTYAYAGKDTVTAWSGPTNWAWFNRAADPAQYLTVLNVVDAGAGDDQLDGGQGRDDIYAGGGIDTFIFAPMAHGLPDGAPQTTIWSLELASETLDLSAFGPMTEWTGAPSPDSATFQITHMPEPINVQTAWWQLEVVLAGETDANLIIQVQATSFDDLTAANLTFTQAGLF